MYGSGYMTEKMNIDKFSLKAIKLWSLHGSKKKNWKISKVNLKHIPEEPDHIYVLFINLYSQLGHKYIHIFGVVGTNLP